MDKISVIVPVWNAHDYLRRCVDSILNQTYPNIELLLVDDGSSDDSYAICCEYEEKDNRVRAFTKENGGQGSARNFALDKVTGEFIGFVDNDDWIFPTMYERLHQLIVDYDASIARCDDMQGKMEESVSSNNSTITLTDKADFFALMYQDIWGGHVTDRLFKKTVIGKNRFPVSKTIEDMRFMRSILSNIDSEVSSDEKLYFYTIRENQTSSVYARSHINAYERAIEFSSRYEEAKIKYPMFCELLLMKAASFSCSAMKTLATQKNRNLKEYKELKKFILENKKAILCLKNLKLKYKLYIALVV